MENMSTEKVFTYKNNEDLRSYMISALKRSNSNFLKLVLGRWERGSFFIEPAIQKITKDEYPSIKNLYYN